MKKRAIIYGSLVFLTLPVLTICAPAGAKTCAAAEAVAVEAESKVAVEAEIESAVAPISGAEPAPAVAPVEATVVEINEFGNAVLDIMTEDFFALGYENGDSVNAYFSGGTTLLEIPVYDFYYAPVDTGEICTYYDELNFGGVECSFAEITGVKEGETVRIEMEEEDQFLHTQELCRLPRAEEKEDWQTDLQFSNFREVRGGRIREGVLYRSASAVVPSYNRVELLSGIIEEHGIRTVIDLADTEDVLEEVRAEYPEIAAQYDSINYNFIKMGIDFGSEETDDCVAQVIRFIRDGEAPILIHCHLGQDRTGFISAFLEALCGASYEEIRADYMLTYANLYGFDEESDPEKFEYFAAKLDRMIEDITGVEAEEAIHSLDLEQCTKEYLLEAGVSEEDIEIVQGKLCGEGEE